MRPFPELTSVTGAADIFSQSGPNNGGVVEWSIAPVLKTGEPKGSVGSNPTPSAKGSNFT